MSDQANREQEEFEQAFEREWGRLWNVRFDDSKHEAMHWAEWAWQLQAERLEKQIERLKEETRLCRAAVVDAESTLSRWVKAENHTIEALEKEIEEAIQQHCNNVCSLTEVNRDIDGNWTHDNGKVICDATEARERRYNRQREQQGEL